jgi:hypothetical protein
VLDANGNSRYLPATTIGTTNFTVRDPQLPMTYQSPQMFVALTPLNIPAATAPPNVTVMLQRLACPYIPPNDPVSATFDPTKPVNPYVTIDYAENIKTWDNRLANENGTPATLPATDEASFFATGRRQPYRALTEIQQPPYTSVAAGSNGMALPQAAINVISTNGFSPAGGTIAIYADQGGGVFSWQYITYTGVDPTKTQFTGCAGGTGTLATGQRVTPMGQPQNTFFRHNSIENVNPSAATPNQTLDIPFDWLVQLDRPLVNSLELLHVSGYRQHELTQRFITAAGVKNQHYAPWQNPSAMIYRALELMGVPSYLNGTTNGGRVPGKININTVNDFEIFQALCDARAGFSVFTDNGPGNGDVWNLYQRLLASRTPNGAPGPNDRPFRPFASGFIANTTPPFGAAGDPQYANGLGIDDTLLRTMGAPAPNLSSAAQAVPPYSNLLFSVGAANANHPYQQMELLQKLYNNVTMTSNVFAVWLTVGFFEVDDSFTPPKIGSEIGRDQGRQIRHRMFALVDRSQMALFNSAITGLINPGTVNLGLVMPGNGTTVNGGNWTLQAGMLLEVGTPGNSEVVAVRTAGANLVADFTGTWAAGTQIICRGNPGPWLSYNPRNDPTVVPYFTVIQ